MKSIKLILSISLIAIVFMSCRKDNDGPYQQVDNPSMKELIVPKGFDWATTKDVDVNLSISGTKAYEAKSRVYIYNQNPEDGGSLLASGTATPGQSFQTIMRIPSYMKEVFLKMESAFGEVRTATVPVVNNLISYSFNLKSSGQLKVFTEPNCDDCDVVVTQSTGKVEIKNGQTYCFTETFNGEIEFKDDNGTVKICGVVNIVSGGNPKEFKVDKNGSSVIVTQGGTLSTGKFLLDANNLTLEVWSNSSLFTDEDIVFKKNGGVITNYGLIESNGKFEFENIGVYNNGTMQTYDEIELKKNTTFENYCSLYTLDQDAGDMIVEKDASYISYTGYLKVAGELTIKDVFELWDLSMVHAYKLTADEGPMVGYGDLNTVYVVDEIDIAGNFDVQNAIEMVYAAGASVSNDGDFTGGATLVSEDNATNFIPVNACNPDGFGAPVIVDTDLDGVPDELDEYPTDNQRASNSYFPALGIWGTVAFEDLWPAQGDYDFNDLILDFTGYYVLNADNAVKDFIISFRVRAVGASFNNGFGFQLEKVTPDQVESVSGLVHQSSLMDIVLNANGTEAGQSKAVIIPVESVENIITRTGPGSMFNTVPGAGAGTYQEVEIVVTFVDAIPLANIGLQDFNPFLIRNQNRAHEVHLPDMPPTDLANFELFGTSQDASDPNAGIYYKTKNELPWAIMFYEIFEYPIELNDISKTYLKFAEWAQSGGVLSPDWYSNTAPGYRAVEKIY